MMAAAGQPPTSAFAAGRDPWRDLYTADVVRLIGTTVNIENQKQLDRLGLEICRTVEPYLVIGDEEDIACTIPARIRMIDERLVAPAKALIKALDRNDSSYLSLWPGGELEWIDRSLRPPPKWWVDSLTWIDGKIKSPKGSLRDIGHETTYREFWTVELHRLLKWAEEKKKLLRSTRPRKRPQTLFRSELVYDLLLLHEALFPNRKRTRASHNKFGPRGSRGSARRGYPSMIQNQFVDFVRAAAAPIVGPRENLDRQIKEALERRKAEQKR
jgi:hypothetical protein